MGGEKGSPPNIPGGATLDFDIELFNSKEKWEHTWPVEHTFIDKPNSSYNLPKEESIVTFNLKVFKTKECIKPIYEKNNVKIEIGDENQYPKFIHELLERCAEGNTLLSKLDSQKYKPPIEWNVNNNIYFITLTNVNSKDVPS